MSIAGWLPSLGLRIGEAPPHRAACPPVLFRLIASSDELAHNGTRAAKLEKL